MTTAQLTEWAATLSWDDLSPATIATTRLALADTLAVTVAGSREPAAAMVAALAGRQLPAPESHPGCTVVGFDVTSSAAGAALANGTSAHVLDFDDTHEHVDGHPSAVVVPAALATAEQVGADGATLLLALVAGVEIMARAGRLLPASAYRAGWHATSVVGPIGAAVAAGRILGLDPPRLATAIGIAVSQSAGSRHNFGTMTKPLHCGWAAHSGVLAAELARAGFTAGADPLTGPLGLAQMFGADTRGNDLGAAEDGAGDDGARSDDPLGVPDAGRPAILTPGLGRKRFPCCAGAHCALDSLLEALGELDRLGDRLDRIDVVLDRDGLVPLVHDWPRSGLEAKFSLRFLLAAAAADRTITQQTFSDERVCSGLDHPLMRRIEISLDEFTSVPYAQVSVLGVGGHRVTRRGEIARGCPGNELGLAELQAKFVACVEPSLAHAGAGAVWSLLLGLDGTTGATTLTRLLRRRADLHP